jgi:hypothetical protein
MLVGAFNAHLRVCVLKYDGNATWPGECAVVRTHTSCNCWALQEVDGGARRLQPPLYLSRLVSFQGGGFVYRRTVLWCAEAHLSRSALSSCIPGEGGAVVLQRDTSSVDWSGGCLLFFCSGDAFCYWPGLHVGCGVLCIRFCMGSVLPAAGV